MEKTIQLLRELMTIPGISGYESRVAEYMQHNLSECTDEVYTDYMGNVIGKITGTDTEAPVVMIFAHMDQIGMVVTSICDDGLLKVTKNGSIPDKVMPGVELLVGRDDGTYVSGVAGVKPHHAMTEADKAKVEQLTDIFIDIGAKSEEDVHKIGVCVGCPVQYKPNFIELANGRYAGTAIDNRAGCAAILMCAEKLFTERPKATTYFVGTVQEEHNLRGGMIAARQAKPDIAFCFDISHDSGQPGMFKSCDNLMGTGPNLNMYSFHGRGTLNGTIPNKKLVDLAQRSADELGMNLNRFAMRGLLADSAYVQLEGEQGTAVLDMGIPVRYAHSCTEVGDVSDLDGLVTLTCAMVEGIDAEFDFSRF